MLAFVLFRLYNLWGFSGGERRGGGVGAYKGQEDEEIIPPEVAQGDVSGYQSQEDSDTGECEKTREDGDEALVSGGFVAA